MQLIQSKHRINKDEQEISANDGCKYSTRKKIKKSIFILFFFKFGPHENL